MTPQTDFNKAMMQRQNAPASLSQHDQAADKHTSQDVLATARSRGTPVFVGIDLSDATSQQYADRASSYLTASSIAINLDATDIPGNQPVLMQ